MLKTIAIVLGLLLCTACAKADSSKNQPQETPPEAQIQDDFKLLTHAIYVKDWDTARDMITNRRGITAPLPEDPMENEPYWNSPLKEAVEAQNLEMVQLLVSNGAPPDEAFGGGYLVDEFLIDTAVRKGNTAIVRFLVDSITNDRVYYISLSLVALALNSKNYELADFLISQKDKIDLDEGATLYELIDKEGINYFTNKCGLSPEKIKTLSPKMIAPAFDIHPEVPLGERIFSGSQLSNDIERLELLGFDINFVDERNRTIWHYIFFNTYTEWGLEEKPEQFISYLAKKNPNIFLTNNNGEAAYLHLKKFESSLAKLGITLPPGDYAVNTMLTPEEFAKLYKK